MQNISDAAVLADSTLVVPKSEERTRSFTLDTSFVLFFLAMDLGQTALRFDVVSILSVTTLAAFIVLPYFLPFAGEGRSFVLWLVGRIFVAGAGLLSGVILGQAVGLLLPDTFRFVPMTLLIVAAIICCNIQIYDILKNRLAR